MGFIFNRTSKDEPECLGMRVVDGTIKKCCDPSKRKGTLPELVAEPSADKIARVVTLVHGTFAQHAPWMQDKPKNIEEGALCSALRGIEGTAIRRFCWSGGNSHSARLQAGDDLAFYLGQLRTEFPQSQHFVIAHSHGGNVAMYAMELESSEGKKLAEGIAGVITLATPFITLRKRRLPKFVIPSALIALAFIIAVWVISVIKPFTGADPIVIQINATTSEGIETAESKAAESIAAEAEAAESEATTLAGTKTAETKGTKTTAAKDSLDWAIILSLATLFVVWVAGTLISAWLYSRKSFNFGILWQIFRERNKADQRLLDDQLRAFQPQNFDADKLLVMRPLGDEANMSLVVSQSLSYAQNKLLSFLQGFQDGVLGRSSSPASPESSGEVTKPKRRSGCLMSLLKLISLLALFIGVSAWSDDNSAEGHAFSTIYEAIDRAMPGEWYQNLPLLIPMILFSGLLAFFIIFGFMSLYALIGLLLSAAPFGWDAMFWNHFTSTTAEPAPVGSSPTRIFHAAPKDGSVDPGLAHSGIYTNPVAVEQIVDWIKKR